MDKISMDLGEKSIMGDVMSLEKEGKKRIAKSFMDYGGIFLGVVIVFAVIFIVSNDITITSVWDAASFGIDFFLLLFCTYAMYIGCADSGSKAGFRTAVYERASDRFEEKKRKVIESGHQKRLNEFCQDYIARELRSARIAILANAGIDFDVYIKLYEGKDKGTVNTMEGLSKLQKKAINAANNVKPIRLTSEMIMMRDTSANRRSPLGMHPKTKKAFAFGGKFLSVASITIITTAAVLQTATEPVSVIIATCAMKLVTIVINGFMGYKMGYENISEDTVNYLNNQADLMEQAIHFCNEHGGSKEDEKPHKDFLPDEIGNGEDLGGGEFHQ